MELLSPAGNRDALVAALSCGADAVYLGYTAFGARSYAGNFDAQQLAEAVEYAHERGKKIFVTVNTLVKQCEVDDLCDVLELLCKVNADAAIVQDLGVARIARAQFPQLTLHASTQMTIHNAQGAKLMQDFGFSRVVPARECSLSELRKMADTGVEIEAFAHGALCVAVSGQCLFSSMIGGRSGNRGRCAQPCRLPYQLDDGTNGYLLSTRDLMLIEHLPKMRDAGVYSYKLEGRMKRPEYVGVITRAYREALDAAEAHVPYKPSADTIKQLKQVFNRGGFTEGYVLEKSNAALMSWQRPNHWGIPVGKITSIRCQLAKVALTDDLHDGDGLQIRGKAEMDLTYSGNDAAKGTEATVRIPASGAKNGDAVFRLTDALQMKDIRDQMTREYAPIALTAKMKAFPGELPVLTLSDNDGHSVSVTGVAVVDRAQQHAMSAENALKQLSKTGGTPYVITSFSLESEDAFMPSGALNALRRDALAAIRAARIAPVQVSASANEQKVELPAAERKLIAQGERLADAGALIESGADSFAWSPEVFTPGSILRDLKANPEAKPLLVLPSVMSTEELRAVHCMVCENADRFSGVVLNNPGQFGLEWPVEVTGGQGLNVMNSECARYFTAHGAKRLSASCELNSRELKELFKHGGNYEIEVYGKAVLMLLSHCPRRTKAGDTKQDQACQACAANGGIPAVYTDRKGYRFEAHRQRMEHGCVVRLYNSVKTDMAKSAGKIADLGCSFRLSFTDEPLERQMELVASYRSILQGGASLHQADENTTTGHLTRGVE